MGSPDSALPCQLLPGSAQEPSAHLRPTCTNPEEHRGTVAGRSGPELRIPWGPPPVWASPRAAPAKLSPSVQVWSLLPWEQHSESPSGLRGLLPRGKTPSVMQGKGNLASHRIWGEESKVEKGKGLDDSGRNKNGKFEGYATQKGLLYVNCGLVSLYVWPCHLPGKQSVLSFH